MKCFLNFFRHDFFITESDMQGNKDITDAIDEQLETLVTYTKIFEESIEKLYYAQINSDIKNDVLKTILDFQQYLSMFGEEVERLVLLYFICPPSGINYNMHKKLNCVYITYKLNSNFNNYIPEYVNKWVLSLKENTKYNISINRSIKIIGDYPMK